MRMPPHQPIAWTPERVRALPDDGRRYELIDEELIVTPTPRLVRQRVLLRLYNEILSPSTAHHDRGIKRRYYQRNRTPEYWAVDAQQQLIERWRPDTVPAEVARNTLEWQPAPEHPALTLDLDVLFADLDPE